MISQAVVHMIHIAECKGVKIFAPICGKFSFFKSPFAAHTSLSAVDIYPGGDFGDMAPSPVEGTVIDIREYSTPTPFIEQDFIEYITAIKQGDSVVKILHIKPTVTIGDTISVGDPFGTLIHNGYFYFWNDPAMHVEVRKTGDYIRASNHNPLITSIDFSSPDYSLKSEIHCKVVFCNERYALLKGRYEGQDVKGFELGGCLLDGLIPVGSVNSIDYFGLIGKCVPVPYIKSAGNRFMISSHHLKASIVSDVCNKHVDCLALGFSLFFSEPTIKVIPLTYDQKHFNVEDEVTIRMSLNKNIYNMNSKEKTGYVN
jgi:hypothetical protein